MFEDRIHFCGKGYNIPSQIKSYDEEVIVFHNDIQEDPELSKQVGKQSKIKRKRKRKHKRSY